MIQITIDKGMKELWPDSVLGCIQCKVKVEESSEELLEEIEKFSRHLQDTIEKVPDILWEHMMYPGLMGIFCGWLRRKEHIIKGLEKKRSTSNFSLCLRMRRGHLEILPVIRCGRGLQRVRRKFLW